MFSPDLEGVRTEIEYVDEQLVLEETDSVELAVLDKEIRWLGDWISDYPERMRSMKELANEATALDWRRELLQRRLEQLTTDPE